MWGDKHHITTGCWDNLFCDCPKQFIKTVGNVKTTSVVVFVEASFFIQNNGEIYQFGFW